MDLSIIIVNHRSWEHLERCLDSLRPLADGGPPETEIIVVDNASDDGLAKDFTERYPRIRWVLESNNFGFSYGCNAGARRATGTELLFLNPDIVDPGGAVAEFWKIKKDSRERGILTVRQTNETGSTQRVFEAFPSPLTMFGPARALLRLSMPAHFPDAKHLETERQLVDWVSGSALMISAADFERLGGWCEEFWLYSEDVDLCRRAWNSGLQVVYDPTVTLIHCHGGSSRRDPEIKALTKSEVLISRHLDAARHLPLVSRWWFHAAAFATAYVPRALTVPLAVLLRSGPVKLERAIFEHLSRYYRSVLRHRSWIGPRSIRYPGREASGTAFETDRATDR